MEALQGDPHARNVFGILAWAYDYADDYAGIRRETLALGLREFRLLRALLRRAEAAGELRLGLDGHECAGCWPPGGWERPPAAWRRLTAAAWPPGRGTRVRCGCCMR